MAFAVYSHYTPGLLCQGSIRRTRAPGSFPRAFGRFALTSQNSRFSGLHRLHARFGGVDPEKQRGQRGGMERMQRGTAVRVQADNENVAFVAGAAGRTGVRVVRELAARGFKVRAGVRSLSKSPEDIFNGKDAYNGGGVTPVVNVEGVELVEFDVEDPASLPAAIGDATIIVCCIGAPEDKPLDASLPKRIDGTGTKNLIEAARAAGIRHFVLQSSLGTGRFGWPAAVLNLFWGVLDHKRDAELALVASGVPFTIVRPGGMERPTDAYEETHNILLAAPDTTFGGQISRRQVAAICADAACHPAAATNKIVEVVAEEGALAAPVPAMLERISPVVQGGADVAPGTVGYYERKYTFKDSWQARWLEVMGFGGMAPEAINGRLAMLGALGILGAEADNQGTLLEQFGDNAVFVAAMTVAVIGTSLIPFFKGVTASDAKAGPFNQFAEITNGRLAMLALSTILYTELSTDDVFWDLVVEKVPFLS
uniref:NAD(P)-binding domain-containing protein n=2 Tax=Pyramimonas obovata TaxID=1411642 RepID=A0A7S0WZ20_9CHLO|mmetsp:Transcript_9559/g.19801  ORF Transcript_9559/g.19801 Transcript_9559/m.19801 type:complete len:482 (+) Transcript_9559:61-1506(+)